MSNVKPDSRKPGGVYMIANLGNVVVETAIVKHAQDLYNLLQLAAEGEDVHLRAKNLLALIGKSK